MSVSASSMRFSSLGLTLAVLGCTGDPTLVGDVSGTDSVVGIVLRENTAQMYVCGGPDNLEVHHHWVDLTLDGTTWSGSTDGLEVTFEGDDSGVLGEITDGTELWPFTAAPGRGGDGPWRSSADLDGCEAGVVVRNGGAAMQGVHYCPAVPSFAQVVPIGVFRPGSGEIEVGVLDTPEVQFTVFPVDPGT